MLRVIEDAEVIEDCQSRLRAAVEKVATENHVQTVAFPSGSARAQVFYVAPLDFWMTFKPIDNRYWNCGGLGYPFTATAPVPSVEINPPLAGIDRRMAGAFIEDDDGVLYIGHSGKVGGGTKGVSKTNFLVHHRDWSTVRSGDRDMPMYVIGRLDDGRLPQLLRDFTDRSAQFRAAIKAGRIPREPTLLDDEESFAREFDGTRRYRTSEQVEADYLHGRVVNALRDQLRERGVEAFNTMARDLYIGDRRGNTRVLFEVKSAADTTSIYAAVGQLMFHGGAGKADRLVAVLPKGLSESARTRLGALSIDVVSFTAGSEGRITFNGLDQIVGGRTSGRARKS